MNPGTSARNTSGMLKASQHQMNRAALSAESTNSVPARWAELLATMPTGWPSRRARPTISSRANSGLISKKLCRSTMPSMTTCMSNGTRSSAGTMSGVSSTSGGSDSYTGGASRHVRGKYDRYALAWSMASWSSTARLSAQPGLRHVHPRPAHLLQRGDLADDHLGHARRAEVHRGVAVDHEHDVAERRDVRPAGRRRAEQAADLRHLAGQADLVVEDVPGAAAAGEQLDLVGQPGARPSRRATRSAPARRAPPPTPAPSSRPSARPTSRPSPSGRWRRRSPACRRSCRAR